MDAGDVLYRISGVALALASLLDALLALLWLLSFAWLWIGLLWLVPLALALAGVAAGLLMLATGRRFPLTAFAPLLGLVASACNFDLVGSLLDAAALALGLLGFALVALRPYDRERSGTGGGVPT